MGFSPTLFADAAPRSGRRSQRPTAPREWWPITAGSVLLAIDPSVCRTGFALLLKTDRDPIRLNSGIIYPRGSDDVSRFDDLAAQVAAQCRPFRLNGVDHVPTDAVIEVPSGGQRGERSAFQLMQYARAVGVCEAACYFGGLSVNRVPVQTWTRGKSKERRAMEVKQLLHYVARDHNELDAVALGLWLCAQK